MHQRNKAQQTPSNWLKEIVIGLGLINTHMHSRVARYEPTAGSDYLLQGHGKAAVDMEFILCFRAPIQSAGSLIDRAK